MLDPLTALGLASNIAQLIEFSVSTVGLVTKIRLKGSSEEVSNLKDATTHMIELCASIHDRTGPNSRVPVSLTKEEKVRELCLVVENRETAVSGSTSWFICASLIPETFS